MHKPIDLTKFAKGQQKSLQIAVGFQDPKTWISTGNMLLDYIISGKFRGGGIPMSKLSMFAGESGCLPVHSTVKVRYTKDTSSVEKEITVGELREMYMSGEYEIELDTPDGYQYVTDWFDKGELDMVTVTTPSFKTECAVNHMIQLSDETWKPAAEMEVGDEVITTNGIEVVTSVQPHDEKQECYDFTINHENHRYYGDGISSHNSGKSFLVSGNIARNAQKQGIIPILIDTENALDEEWLVRMGIDTSPDKLLRIQVSLISHVAKFISDFVKDYKAIYKDVDPEERQKYLIIIDSLGMMVTETDIAQVEKGDLKGDMGRKPKQLNALVRNSINLITDTDIGIVCTNHTYASQDMFDPDDKISGGCLVAGTELYTNNGLKTIESMEIGDYVLSNDGQYHEVIQTWHYQKPTRKIQFSDGTEYECSPEHKFAVVDGDIWHWVEAKDFDTGMLVKSFDGEGGETTLEVMSISDHDVKDVYDIQVEDTANYILKNGIWSHNSGAIFASSIVVASKKYKLKEDEQGVKGKDVLGVRTTFKIMKTRYGRPFETGNIHIRFDSGMDKYSGLLEYFEKEGVVVKDGNKLKYIDQSGTEHKEFRKNFGNDILDIIIDEWDYENKRQLSVHKEEEIHEEHEDIELDGVDPESFEEA